MNYITYNPTITNNGFIAYLVRDINTDRVLFAGAGRLSDIIHLREVSKITTFEIDKDYKIELHKIQKYITMAKSEADLLVKTYHPNHTPKLNMDYLNCKRNLIRCVETGETYRNQAEVCGTNCLTQSMISNHLNRRPGYKSIHGRHYEYVSTPSTEYPDAVSYPTTTPIIGVFNSKMVNKYLTYIVHNGQTGEPLYLGVDNFVTAITLLKLKGVPDINMDTLYTINILNVANSLEEAKRFKSNLRVQSYFYNVFIRDTERGIKCVETGETFRTQGELSKAIGATTSRISKHLNRLSGFRSIYGKQYVKLECQA